MFYVSFIYPKEPDHSDPRELGGETNTTEFTGARSKYSLPPPSIGTYSSLYRNFLLPLWEPTPPSIGTSSSLYGNLLLPLWEPPPPSIGTSSSLYRDLLLPL